MENQELKLIKKTYGEEMMHLCRDLFPTLLEKPNLVYSLLEKNFAPTKSLSFDILENKLEENFKNYIYSLIDLGSEPVKTNKTPEELLKEKGYILYECKNEMEVQYFKKYYAKGEKLCTFNGNRLEKCHVFFAVKENVEEIRREDFINPERQDLYGTSVISIQFSRGEINTLSIKNRYNHTVENPDATYSNNLENIIPGLTYSFEKKYDLNIDSDTNYHSFFLTDRLKYVKGKNNKYYRYNNEINNIYYCENNIIIDNGELIDKYSKEKERYILMDLFIIDKKQKLISLYDNSISDCFINSINSLGKIKNIKSTKNKDITIEYDDGKIINIGLNKGNDIIKYKNEYIENIGNSFLNFNKKMKYLELPNVKTIGDNFLPQNNSIEKIKLDNVEIIGNSFLSDNNKIKYLELPNAKIIGDNFLARNNPIEKIKLDNVEIIGDSFLHFNEKMKYLELPNTKIIGDNFLARNNSIEKIKLDNVEIIGDSFLHFNEKLEYLELPNAKIIENSFLSINQNLKHLELPNVEIIKCDFLVFNKELIEIKLPKTKIIGDSFLINNRKLEEIDLPNVVIIKNNFLLSNEQMKKLKLPNTKTIGDYFLAKNKKLEEIDLQSITNIGNDFLLFNKKISIKKLTDNKNLVKIKRKK